MVMALAMNLGPASVMQVGQAWTAQCNSNVLILSAPATASALMASVIARQDSWGLAAAERQEVATHHVAQAACAILLPRNASAKLDTSGFHAQ